MWRSFEAGRPRIHKDACARLYDQMGVRHAEMWKSEAEDEIVQAVRTLDLVLNLEGLATLSQLLHWHRIHILGESRSSLMAKCLEGEVSELPDTLEGGKP